MKKINVVSYVLTIGIMALIFFFSSRNAELSSAASTGITKKIAEIITVVVNTEKTESFMDTLHFAVRKTAHFSLYFLLAVSSSDTAGRLFEKKGAKVAMYSLPFCLFYAVTDEIHQIFVPGRTAKVSDVMIDFCGALTGYALFYCISVLRKRRKKDDV